MNFILKNVQVYRHGGFRREDIAVSGGFLVDPRTASDLVPIDGDGLTVFPGFADVHVHFREPGFSYKETIRSGSLAAARGGYTTVCAMPNLNPAPDSLEHLAVEQAIIDRDAVIEVLPYGTITVNEEGAELADLAALAPHVAAFSDDGHGVQKGDRMEEAMREAKKLGKLIVAHCEDNDLLFGGYIHDGPYAAAHGHRGIRSESEWLQVARDVELCEETGCAYHVCHVSTKESVEIIRDAKRRGVNVTCETAPHYLLLDESQLQEDGRFKMNPPLRCPADQEALLEGVRDGTIDAIITDHAPHSAEEKSRGLDKSAMGIVGLETAFPLLYTYLVKPGTISLEKVVELLTVSPRRRFSLDGSGLEIGDRADFTVFDLNARYPIDPEEFQSKGRSTPFEGWPVCGRCRLTVSRGRVAWNEGVLNIAE